MSTELARSYGIQLYGGAQDGLMLESRAEPAEVICFEGQWYERKGTVPAQEAVEAVELMPGLKFRGHGAKPEMWRYVLRGWGVAGKSAA